MHPLLLLTHWIFRSLTLPYKSSSHSAKCVRCASLRSGGRRLSVRIAMGCQIGALPRTPFPASRDFPSRGNERYEGKKASHIFHVPFRRFPFWWLAPPPFPVGSMLLDSRVAYSSPMNPVPLPPPQFGGAAKGKRLNGQARRLTSPHCGGPMQDLHSGTITRAYCRAIYEESVSRCFILPPLAGGSPAQPG